MEREELRSLLRKLSDSEIRHKANAEQDRKRPKTPNEADDGAQEPIQVLDFNTNLGFITERNKKFFKKTGSHSLNLQLAITQHTRFSIFPVHIHNYVEMNYVYAGQCRQLINGTPVVLQEGDICILDTHVPHTILETSEDDIIINLIMLKSFFNASFLSRLAGTGIISDFLVNAISQTQNHNRYIIFHTGNEARVKDTMEILMCEYFDPAICSKEMIESYLIILFSELLRTFQRKQAKDYGAHSATYLVDILKYIEDHYKACTLASTAERFNFHPNYLSAYLRKATGRTFKELVQIQRMTMASLLLTGTSLTVGEIANEIGYNNLGFFYKKFVGYFGQTPHEYRRQNS